MAGGLMQLSAYGPLDVTLTGNPQITFFKAVYRRHTNFSMESIEQTINGSVGSSSRVTSTISRNGDLVSRLFYEFSGLIDLPDAPGFGRGYYANVGALIFDNVEIEIGGQRIDRQTGQWIQVSAALTQKNDARLVSAYLTGGDPGDPFIPSTGTDEISSVRAGTLFQELTAMGGTNIIASPFNFWDPMQKIKLDTTVPIMFWFTRNPGLAIPLISLQYHEVKVVTTFSDFMSSSLDTKLWADYIYLDIDERRRFAQETHEYLIEQVQFQSGSIASSSTVLNFNHPVKELIWTTGFDKMDGFNNLLRGIHHDLEDGNYQLMLNGHDRMAARPREYFTKQQVWMHHTGPGDIGTSPGVGGSGQGIAVYSFALKPEEHQPSGTCNFSRIDTARLKGPAQALDVFAINYNILRIMSGMGGLAFSN
jgi:hypothetical protein